MAHRPTDWHLVGRDKDPTPGDPEVLRDWERYFRHRADDADRCMGKLRGIQYNAHTLDLEGTWITAIWGRCDYLADLLLPEKTCHDEVADALRVFRQTLPDLQQSADAGLDMARDAVKDRDHASGQLNSLADQMATAQNAAGVCAPASSQQIGQRQSWQSKLDDANSKLTRAKNIVDTAAEQFSTAANQVVMALNDSEQTLGSGVCSPPAPDRDTTKPVQPSFLHQYVDQALTDLYGLAAITAGTLKGADSIGMNVETMMMFGGPEGGGPSSEFALADGSASSSLANAYAFGGNPFKDYAISPEELDGSWLTRTWEARPDIAGPAQGKTLKSPNQRHTIMGSKSGNADEENTIILPGMGKQVEDDISAIAEGKARWNDEAGRYEINGRTYAVKSTGTVFPDSGPGFVKLDRVEYNALKLITKSGGDLSRCQRAFDNDPKFKNNPEKVEAALALYRTYYS